MQIRAKKMTLSGESSSFGDRHAMINKALDADGTKFVFPIVQIGGEANPRPPLWRSAHRSR